MDARRERAQRLGRQQRHLAAEGDVLAAGEALQPKDSAAARVREGQQHAHDEEGGVALGGRDLVLEVDAAVHALLVLVVAAEDLRAVHVLHVGNCRLGDDDARAKRGRAGAARGHDRGRAALRVDGVGPVGLLVLLAAVDGRRAEQKREGPAERKRAQQVRVRGVGVREEGGALDGGQVRRERA